MQKKRVVHRDLKPENILLCSKERGNLEIRIADFGFATVLSDQTKSSETRVICGTPGYIPPEVLNGNRYNLKSDLFAAGGIMYNLSTLKNLFLATEYD